MAERISFNKNFFEIATIESAYWAGLIAADGCVHEPKDTHKQYRLELKLTDETLITKFHSTIESTGKINIINSNLYPSSSLRKKDYKLAYKIDLNSDKLCGDLFSNYNIGPRKSLTLKPPNIREEFWLPFIKGYIDGDGWLSYDKRACGKASGFQMGILGTQEILLWIGTVLGPRTLTLRNKFYQYQICGLPGVKAAMRLKESTELGLARKWDKVS